MKTTQAVPKRSVKPSLEKPTGRSYPRVIFISSVLIAMVIFTLSYFKKDGFKNIRKVDESIRVERENLKRVKEENRILRDKIKTVRTNSYQVEKFAREKLSLAKDDELIFRFRDSKEKEF